MGIRFDQELAERITAVRGWPAGEIPAGKRLTVHTGVVVDVALT